MAKKTRGLKRARPAARKASPKKKASARRATKRAAKKPARRAARPVRRSSPRTATIADVRRAEVRKDVGGVRLEAGRAGAGRVKRMIYPPGYKWSIDTKPHVGTDYCMHAHVGFLVQGRIDVIYSDGCVEVFEAPQIVAVAPGHDGHVVGSESAVLIEFDFEGETVERFGMPPAHTHE